PQLPAGAGGDRLHPGEPRTGVPHLPRCLVDVSESRHQQPEVERRPSEVRDRVRGAHRRGQRQLPADGRDGSGVVIGSLDAHIPEGPIEQKWDNHKFDVKLVNPANKRKFHVLVVGSGLAGASAAATLGELGYRVTMLTFHDTPRRAHSIAAQGGINAAKNYRNDGDSVYRLFYDTVKGGDFRAR